MTVRSDLLAAFNAGLAAGQTVTVGTVPAGQRWLVRELGLLSSGGIVTTTLLVYATSGGLVVPMASIALPVLGVGNFSGRYYVLPAGWAIILNTTAAATVACAVQGVRFVVP